MSDMRRDTTAPEVIYTALGGPSPEYPPGLRIVLEEPEIKKLGFALFPHVGNRFEFKAVAEVKSVNTEERDGADGPQRRLSLQIVEMEAGEEEDERRPHQVMYEMEDQ